MAERTDWHKMWPEVPQGHQVVAVPDPDWRLQGGRNCRFVTGPGHHTCRAPAIAELNRSRRGSERPNWWAYCEKHLFGRWIEDGRVMRWILRKQEPVGVTRG